MAKENLQELKEKLLDIGWTEDFHHALEELDAPDARMIVESLTETEIDTKVNIRQFQDDYIADYLEYVAEISMDAYWKHVKVSLKGGFLWGRELWCLERMCNTAIPQDVLQAVIVAIGTIADKADLEAIGCVNESPRGKPLGILEQFQLI